jgi:hypothetical protein
MLRWQKLFIRDFRHGKVRIVQPKIRQAIARVVASRRANEALAGTAFLVSDRHLLTAFHVVGDRFEIQPNGEPVLYADLSISFADGGPKDLVGSVAVGCFDPQSDWALIELKSAVAGMRPIPLGTIAESEMEGLRQRGHQLNFESWGFPSIARISGSGIAIDGRVQDRNARYQDAAAYQLYSDNAAASVGDPLSGLSGAPCMVDGAAVGIIRSNLIASRDTRETARITAGVLYACPLSTATLQERCSAYLPSLDPVRGLPGLPRQELPLEPFCYLRWYGADHAEVFFGRNRKLRDLYYRVCDADSSPVVLVYGASGVGKSSLLEAGLLPRLS